MTEPNSLSTRQKTVIDIPSANTAKNQDEKPLHLDLIAKLTDLSPDSLIYPNQLMELAAFAVDAENRLKKGELGGYSAPEIIRKSVEEIVVQGLYGGDGPGSGNKVLGDYIFKTEQDGPELWRGKLSDDWKKLELDEAGLKKITAKDIVKSSDDLGAKLGKIFSKRVEHWHLACSGADQVLRDLAEDSKERGVKLSAVSGVLSTLQDEREIKRQQTTYLSEREMFTVAGVRTDGRSSENRELQVFAENRIDFYQKKSGQMPTEFEWRQELQAHKNPPLSLSTKALVGGSIGLLTTAALALAGLVGSREQPSAEKPTPAAKENVGASTERLKQTQGEISGSHGR